MQSINKTSKKKLINVENEKKVKMALSKQNENLHRFETDCVEMEKNGVRIRTNNSFESKISTKKNEKIRYAMVRDVFLEKNLFLIL